MSGAVRTGAAVAVVCAGAHLLPSVATIPLVHRRMLPALAGRSAAPHVALTFDDGPDPVSTPRFVEALADLRVHATFFLLGGQLRRHPDVARMLVDAGHELAVHGWRHRPHLLRAPWRVTDDLARTRDLIGEVAGVAPRFARPPNGVVTGAGLVAARRLGLRTVLWTADGRDWQRAATPGSVASRVRGQLSGGGVVLLHDSDLTSAPQSWASALGALPEIVRWCRRSGWEVGPLRGHWPRL